MKRLVIIFLWLPVTLATLAVTIALQNFRYQQTFTDNLQSFSQYLDKWSNTNAYQLYSSLPKVLGATTASITGKDAIPEIVKNYLTKHNSPMTPYAQDLINAGNQYNIDPLLLVAIAQCESNLGKKMPKNCNNPFGWGIHSKGTLCFPTWKEGFYTVAKGLRDKYFNKGLNSPTELMTYYTPPALEKGGSWAKCVNQFLDDLKESEQ